MTGDAMAGNERGIQQNLSLVHNYRYTTGDKGVSSTLLLLDTGTTVSSTLLAEYSGTQARYRTSTPFNSTNNLRMN